MSDFNSFLRHNDEWIPIDETDVATALSVQTNQATDVSPDSATLNGEITELGDDVATPIDVWFDWRKSGESTWNEADAGTVSSEDAFDAEIVNLEEDAIYEFRAVGESDDGEQADTGEIIEFTTTEDVDSMYVLEPAEDDMAHFTGDTGDYSINDAEPVYSGTYSLKNSDGSSSRLSINSQSGLPAYPAIGHTQRFAVNLRDSTHSQDAMLMMCWAANSQLIYDSGDECYMIDVRGPDGGASFRIRGRWDDEWQTVTASPSGLSLADDWMVFEVLHEANGDFSVDVWDADDYPSGSTIWSDTANDTTLITDGEYDHSGVMVSTSRRTNEVLDSWETGV